MIRLFERTEGGLRPTSSDSTPILSQRKHNFEREKMQYFHHASEGRKERGLRKRYKLQTVLVTSEETMPESQAREDCECLWKKMIGKPYSDRTYGLMWQGMEKCYGLYCSNSPFLDPTVSEIPGRFGQRKMPIAPIKFQFTTQFTTVYYNVMLCYYYDRR